MMNKLDGMVGKKLDGRYEIVEKIHHGSISDIYRGFDHKSSAPIAIKISTPQVSNDSLATKRFQRSLQVQEYLQHPNICAILDRGSVEDSRQLYGIFKYLEGPTLRTVVEKEGPLSLDRFCDIFSALCDALNHLHSHEKCVVHRDLRPANFLITTTDGKEQPVLIDFYLASPINDKGASDLDQMGELIGTAPEYMSPEQCMAHQIKPSSEIYSMGCCMFFALTGQPPFIGNSIIDLMQTHMSTNPPGGKIPASFEPLVFKALEKIPQKRFDSIAEMKELILKMRPNKSSKKFFGFNLSRQKK